MAENKEPKGKAITVRPTQAEHELIERAAHRAGQSMGEWLLATGLQRLHGGPYPRRGRTARDSSLVATTAEVKAGVRPIPKRV